MPPHFMSKHFLLREAEVCCFFFPPKKGAWTKFPNWLWMFCFASDGDFCKNVMRPFFYTSNLIAAAERRSVIHEQGWLTGRSRIQSKRVWWLMWGDVSYLSNFWLKTPLSEIIVSGKTIWMTAAAAGRVRDEITENRKLLLKSTLVLSVMCRRRGHQSDVERTQSRQLESESSPFSG